VWEGGDWPVERGYVKFVDGLGVRGGENAHGASVEGAVEREDAEVRAAGGLVDHARRHLLRTEVTLSLLLSVPHEDGLVRIFVGARSTGHRCDLIEAGRCYVQKNVFQLVVPVGARKYAQGGSIYNSFLKAR